MQSYFAFVDSQQVHFRLGGHGPVLVLLHASPMSSDSLVSFATLLSEHYTVLLPDTPGYGYSTKPIVQPESIHYYATILKLLLMELEIPTCSIYGTATGAQIGMRFALDFPDLVDHLYLDNCAHFTSQQRQAILNDYFPDLSPSADGAHLLRLWPMVRGLFTHFPWCWQEPKYALSSPMPPNYILQLVASFYLQAGVAYDWAYRAAFAHEDAANVQALTISTTIIDWAGSILQPYIQQLLAHELPADVETLSIVENPGERLTAMAAYIKERTSKQSISVSLQHVRPSNISPQSIPPNLPDLVTDKSGEFLQQAWVRLLNLQPQYKPDIATQQLIAWLRKPATL